MSVLSNSSDANLSNFEPKIDRETLGRGIGGILAPRAAQESKRETNLGSLAHLGVPKGPPWGTLFFYIFLVIFGVFRSRFFEALFWRLLGSIFHGFGVCFGGIV